MSERILKEIKMNTLDAMIMRDANLGNLLMVFDWIKAANIIKERNAKYASAGLSNDWEWTGGDILRDEKPVPEDDTYVYLASIWATPELDVDGEIMDCFIMKDEMPSTWKGDPAHIYWPLEALQILNGE
jgi:hypothetical protein